MIYLNAASTTKPSKEVIEDFVYCANNLWENPSDISSGGFITKRVIEKAQEQVAKYINCKPEEIFFTSGGSESNNWAIKGTAEQFCPNNHVIITTEIEHPSVYNTCKFLKYKGYTVEFLPVNCFGEVQYSKLDVLLEQYKDKTIFVSIMMANNEIGTINAIETISKKVHSYNGVLHVDAVQAFGQTYIDVEQMGIDMMSVSFHKFNGFKNCGFLYVKKDICLIPLIHGGNQFDGKRSGTENVPMIYALGNQVERLSKSTAMRFVGNLSDYLLNYIYDISDKLNISVFLNGDPSNRLPNNLSLTFKGINAEQLIIMLQEKDVVVSAGAACCSGEKKPSRVLKAIGLTDEETLSTIRISLSNTTTIDECNEFLDILEKTLLKIKMMGGV